MADVSLMVMIGSQYAMKAMAALAYKGVHYQLRIIPPPRLKKDVPGGKVPVMVWDGQVIRDSTEILRVLDEKIPDKPLFPAGNKDVATLEDHIDEGINPYVLYFRWADDQGFKHAMKPAMGGFLPPLVRGILPHVIRPLILRRAGTKVTGMTPEQARDGLTSELAAFDERLAKHAYLCGAQPTAADFALYGMLQAIVGRPEVFPGRPQALTEAKADRVRDWFSRMETDFPISFKRS